MKNTIFWILALAITLAAAVYQRATGPTYPARGEVTLGGAVYKYRLIRSHGGPLNARVMIDVPDPEVSGVLIYKRYKAEEEWTEVPLRRGGNILQAELPHQPPAGKLEYFLRLSRGEDVITVPQNRDIVIRFKGAVPIWVLIPHVFFMFSAMLVSTRAGLEALVKNGQLRHYVLWAAGLLFLGGMIMGPLVQKYAFGALWTGFPFGFDLTDNKTLIAMIGWVVAVFAVLKGKAARLWVVMASILLLLIFSIPHSMIGSELDYSTGQVGTSSVNTE